MSAADPLAPARAKLDEKIADAARALVGSIGAENAQRDGWTRLAVKPEPLSALRAQIAAWEAFNETLGGGA